MELTPSVREVLKRPLGRLVKDASEVPKDRVLIAVGDTASETLISAGFRPKLVVYDAMTRRKQVGVSKTISSYDAEEHRVNNQAGHLERGVFSLFKRCLKAQANCKVFVVGEEDLTALAAVAEAPAGAVVVYGQPGEGLVIVDVDEKSKARVKTIIEEMEDGH
jgi:GTP-dependent dephospho-CoA kinase